MILGASLAGDVLLLVWLVRALAAKGLHDARNTASEVDDFVLERALPSGHVDRR